MKPLEVWTCQKAENLKKKSSKIPKNNYAATMVSAVRRQIRRADQQIWRRRPQIVGGGAARPRTALRAMRKAARSSLFQRRIRRMVKKRGSQRKGIVATTGP